MGESRLLTPLPEVPRGAEIVIDLDPDAADEGGQALLRNGRP